MKQVDKIALAAFLHDIGKFRQRTGRSISDEDLHLFAPSHKTYYSHIHAAHTAKALEEMGFEDFIFGAMHHLNNLEGDERIIQIADRYASSLDRRESNDELKRDNFITSAIETPFSYIYFDIPQKKYYYPLQKFKGKLEITDKKDVNSKEIYEKLYEEFLEEIKSYKFDFSKMEDILVLKSIFEKYTTFIPSSTYKTYPDVSLYDHSLATAAISVAIKRGNEEEFSLIQGDFSAIQKFIFSKLGESNKYIAKILRAKSLFVNIVTDLVALRVVKELDLSVFNIVMSAGGKFTILAHKLDKEDKEKLQNIKNSINEEFKKINFLQTRFVIKDISFDKSSFKLGKFSEVYKRVASEFEEEKLQFESSINVFDGYIQECKNGVCKSCGIVPLKENEELCEYCAKFKELGEKLVKAKYINFNLDDIFSIEISNKKDKEISLSLNSHPLKRVANEVPKFKEEDLYNEKYKFISDRFEEVKAGQVKSFYHIAMDGLIKKDDKFYGRGYLGVLKADIDNLGKIFIYGMREEATFSRILYLSRMIDYFFTNYLMDFIRDKNVYTLFAGGDDLFLIGHYEDIVKTYEWVVNEFKEYTKNKEFHLSSGIFITRPSIPVNLMAEFSEEYLDDAKSLDGKNGVKIFEVVMKNSEFEELIKKREFFEEVYEELKEFSSGITFLYRLYDFMEMRDKLYEDKSFESILQNSRWKYMFRYLVEKNFKDNEKLKEKLYLIANDIEKYGSKLKLPLNMFLYSIRERS
ncbi:type III-A CRISPR-associated protein Cas10/Csm1 [Caminibacter mediatlanticus]|uniref:CRISPR system single-strand-specific deoxyribonuclease Cas10/Csm1 (subtype III-A) n=1 Tax=Caminibacter mediatlanticus TB-2 TaxID=391592 RepID=A0AAI9F1V1_9BACT|nr:type III-A CRISPR-associated protein Cas10/Csm1 [Caminibacter mediatlanticus]EDM23134.1 CRISPR-associated protein, Csm1 family [Caminibacter mediatlanticus TB-2]